MFTALVVCQVDWVLQLVLRLYCGVHSLARQIPLRPCGSSHALTDGLGHSSLDGLADEVWESGAFTFTEGNENGSTRSLVRTPPATDS